MSIDGVLGGAPDSPAIVAPGRRPLTYGALRGLAERTAADFAPAGSPTRPRVAVVLPPGPTLASVMICALINTQVAPLSHRMSESELTFLLRDLAPDAVVLLPGAVPAADAAARSASVPVLAVSSPASGPDADVAGAFELDVTSARNARSGERDDSSSLLLHTSGTTALPKLVGLSLSQLQTSARNIAATLHLTAEDRSLAVMPLFHIHGIAASLLATLASGGTVIATDGFDPFAFGSLLSSQRPTWVSAVPSIHQAVLSATKDVPRHHLRFLRSSSSTLPVPVWERLEATFGCPVVNSYGMTEAAHQMASVPLPPAPRRVGTVGWAAGPEVAILGADGLIRERPASGATSNGEVLVRGPSVIRGYLAPASANETSHVDGWFRTGDLASMDDDGCVTLIGRLKELVNVAGEKVAPAEIDEVMLRHDAVAECAAFAMPCPVRGERVEVAVVLRRDVDERTLQRHARGQLAKFKVPARVHVVSAIPTGPTGKIRRSELSAHFSETGGSTEGPPRF